MNKLYGLFATIVLSSAVFASVAHALPPETQMFFAASGATQIQSGAGSVSGGMGSTDLTVAILEIVKVLMFIVGIVAVVVVIYGGLQYILAAGDQAKITKAKDTILYAIVGLVVAMLAYAIVNFVVNGVTGESGSTGGGGSSGSARATINSAGGTTGGDTSPNSCDNLGSQYQRWTSDGNCHNMDTICGEVNMVFDEPSGNCIARQGLVAANSPVNPNCTMPGPGVMTCD